MMDFFLVGIVYWLLIGASVLLFVWGLWKKSWKGFLWSGIALALPTISLYVGGAEGWFRLAGLLPLLLWVFAYYTKK
ncbi:hypothetical protein V7659_12245 [Neobacillus drentensis]|uniref:hypothetical protein n=2 Tax=Neobacillus drentensis TaxID=220684 RepID=UPI0030015E6A